MLLVGGLMVAPFYSDVEISKTVLRLFSVPGSVRFFEFFV
ncbi:hypothetical protein OCH239_18755 [Roseivivax halodurans JCM 10272]|uniref:Uncharacterized protein n=1 Tax=Roseivivax halodurans JCM 10272 TaxID=1449350 RepID=X7EA46_9RHOB|nr:hypothetical protein OCH239_18755 [Roseivivax halodurans JCM 10272]